MLDPFKNMSDEELDDIIRQDTLQKEQPHKYKDSYDTVSISDFKNMSSEELDALIENESINQKGFVDGIFDNVGAMLQGANEGFQKVGQGIGETLGLEDPQKVKENMSNLEYASEKAVKTAKSPTQAYAFNQIGNVVGETVATAASFGPLGKTLTQIKSPTIVGKTLESAGKAATFIGFNEGVKPGTLEDKADTFASSTLMAASLTPVAQALKFGAGLVTKGAKKVLSPKAQDIAAEFLNEMPKTQYESGIAAQKAATKEGITLTPGEAFKSKNIQSKESLVEKFETRAAARANREVELDNAINTFMSRLSPEPSGASADELTNLSRAIAKRQKNEAKPYYKLAAETRLNDPTTKEFLNDPVIVSTMDQLLKVRAKDDKTYQYLQKLPKNSVLLWDYVARNLKKQADNLRGSDAPGIEVKIEALRERAKQINTAITSQSKALAKAKELWSEGADYEGQVKNLFTTANVPKIKEYRDMAMETFPKEWKAYVRSQINNKISESAEGTIFQSAQKSVFKNPNFSKAVMTALDTPQTQLELERFKRLRTISDRIIYEAKAKDRDTAWGFIPKEIQDVALQGYDETLAKFVTDSKWANQMQDVMNRQISTGEQNKQIARIITNALIFETTSRVGPGE